MEWKENEVIKRISEIENNDLINLNVSGKLTNPDQLVVAAKLEFSRDDDNAKWLLKYEGIQSSSKGLLIKVAPRNINRALRIFDTLIRAFRARGFQFQGSTASLGKHNYEISIREKLIRVDDFKKKPIDILCLKVYSGFPIFEIYDSKSTLIEEKIARIIAKVELNIEYYESAWAQNAQREQAKKVIDEEQGKILSSKNNELDAFKKLLKSAKRHHDVKLIREYINYKEADATHQNELTAELKSWIEWARRKADWYDPSINLQDALLDEADKDKII